MSPRELGTAQAAKPIAATSRGHTAKLAESPNMPISDGVAAEWSCRLGFSLRGGGLEVREQAVPAVLVLLAAVGAAGAEPFPATVLDRHGCPPGAVGGEGDLDFGGVGAVLA